MKLWLYVLNVLLIVRGSFGQAFQVQWKRLIGLTALCRQIPICLQLLVGAHNWVIIPGEVFSKTVSSLPPSSLLSPLPSSWLFHQNIKVARSWTNCVSFLFGFCIISLIHLPEKLRCYPFFAFCHIHCHQILLVLSPATLTSSLTILDLSACADEQLCAQQ